MKFFISLLLFFNLAHASDCPKPANDQVVLTCEKIISSEVKGFTEDKVTIASYKIWTSDKDSSLCVDGGLGTSRSNNKISLRDSKYPQKTREIFKWQRQELAVTADFWKLSIIGSNDDVRKMYPNYPENYEKYNLDHKEKILTISQPTGIKSFATFKLSCK